jgi:tetratricopeptide (TPR) repeat protein
MPLTLENQPPGAGGNPGPHFAVRHLPGALAGLMLVLYGLTLNHWVSPDSLALVARTGGLTWTPCLSGPVTLLVTYPFGWLPGGWIPPAVNLFTAGCAALSLFLLAGSVTRLSPAPSPHPGALAARLVWLPPAFAMLVCGWQSGFWQNAIAATGEMFNLLMFAGVIHCFLKFQVSRKDSWLLYGALIYGLAAANDWAMAVFFPALLVALVWTKQLFLFSPRFLDRLLRRPQSFQLRLLWWLPACGLAGFLVFLVLPVSASLSAAGHQDFWPALKLSLRMYHAALTHIPRSLLLAAGLISVLPVFFMGVRASHFLTGVNRWHTWFGGLFIHLSHGCLLLTGLGLMLDFPLNPRRLALGPASLPLDYLAALAIGYSLGHFLRCTAPQAEIPGRRRRSDFLEQRRQLRLRLTRFFKRSLALGLGVLAIAVPTVLVGKNLPVILRQRMNPAAEYCAQIERSLPPAGAVILGNDSFQLLTLQSALIRSGHSAHYLLLDPAALAQSPGYLDFLKQRNPGFNWGGNPFDPPGSATNEMTLVNRLHELSGTHPIYCLHPAPVMDFTAEFFYFLPHGLLYQLQPYPLYSAFAGPAPAGLGPENEAYWRTFEQQQLAGLVRRANPPRPPPSPGWWPALRYALLAPEPDPAAQIVATEYAGALNDWGVELQRAGNFPAAGRCFAEALQLNPACPPARINQAFNADYQANRAETVARPLETARRMNEYRDWRHVVWAGAVDEPNFCYMLGAFMADHHLYRPAIAQFERVKELSPARLDTYISLAGLFVQCNDLTNGLNAANAILALSPTNRDGLLLKAGAYLKRKIYPPAIPLLTQVLALDPTNQLVRLNRADAYCNLGQFAAARRDYQALIQAAPDAYPAYYALAKMADQEQNSAAAVTHYESFLKYAPPDRPEIPGIIARLKTLKSARP